MKNSFLILSMALAMLFVFSFSGSGVAKEMATADECVAKVKEASKLIQEIGLEAALKRINDHSGPFIWKDSYILVFDDDKAKMLAFRDPSIIGKPFINYKDSNGRLIFKEMLDIAKAKGEGWVSYTVSAKPKKTYVLKVPGEKVVAAAGYYAPLKTIGPMSAEQNEVWAAVKASWEAWKVEDKEKIKDAMHEDYVFWDFSDTSVRGKDLVTNIRMNSVKLDSFELEPKEIKVFGDFALAMYSWTFTGNVGTLSGRTIDAVIKQDGKWQSLGGMSASCAAPARCE
ncbi:MAG: DUF4440 domain-containing protein [Nitrospina sp.]|nr:DUF4440 domain-containing protein [Nitrospina sp.]